MGVPGMHLVVALRAFRATTAGAVTGDGACAYGVGGEAARNSALGDGVEADAGGAWVGRAHTAEVFVTLDVRVEKRDREREREVDESESLKYGKYWFPKLMLVDNNNDIARR